MSVAYYRVVQCTTEDCPFEDETRVPVDEVAPGVLSLVTYLCKFCGIELRKIGEEPADAN